jgi:LPXTG-motif cell wall-anchored protein
VSHDSVVGLLWAILVIAVLIGLSMVFRRRRR